LKIAQGRLGGGAGGLAVSELVVVGAVSEKDDLLK